MDCKCPEDFRIGVEAQLDSEEQDDLYQDDGIQECDDDDDVDDGKCEVYE